ncbi:MAG: VanZ family protein [Parcubacteria group bacterium]
MKKRVIFFLRYYFPALIWAGIIFYFSGVPSLQYSLHNTSEEIILRKGAHFVEFAILAFLLWRIFYAGHKFYPRYAFCWALTLAALYGASDEFHQTFVTGRTGKTIDAIYDAGSVLFTLEMLVVFAGRKLRWKNLAVLFLSVVLLIGLELKMMSETKSFEVSFSQMKISLGYMLEHELNFIRGMRPNGSSSSRADENMSTQIKEKISSVPVTPPQPSPEYKRGGKAMESAAAPLPEKISVSVPFASQAPLGKWDALHEEACEEASIVMLEYYVAQKGLAPENAEKQIQSMVKFEIKNYGDYKDTTAVETAKLAGDFYGLQNLKVIYDFSVSDLKKYLALGKPIIIPAAGRALGNPYFTPPGPLYHNLVLTGYDGDMIIVNDPGTKRGAGYEYDINVLYDAIHDFPGKAEDIEKGRKAMIVLE